MLVCEFGGGGGGGGGGVHSDNLRLVCIQLPLYCQNKCINFKSCVEFSLGGL